MRIGAMPTGSSGELGVEALVAAARDLEARGFDTVWLPGVFGLDPVTTAAVLGRATQRIEVGTAVVPTQPRHPVALAQQALTASAACSGRFTLGVGLSHPLVIEHLYGLSYARRASHMREYLAVLAPLLAGVPAKVAGEEFRVQVGLDVPEAAPVPVVVAALGPRMLELAGRLATGTILWMTGPRTIAEHVVPHLARAAREAGRPRPRVAAGMHALLCAGGDADAARQRVARAIGEYRTMPAYRGMIEREGSDSPDDLALIGDEDALDAGLARLRDAGVTDLEVAVMRADDETMSHTLDFFASRRRAPDEGAE